MKGILILEITTSAPSDLLRDRYNITLEVGSAGMTWKPEIDQIQFMETELPHEEEQKAINSPKKKQKAFDYPFNMGMHLGMSLVGEGD